MPGGVVANAGALRSEQHEIEADESGKKKKGMMGRLKSSISTKLGRRKSASNVFTSPTDKDVAARERQPEAADLEPSSARGSHQQDEDENEENDVESMSEKAPVIQSSPSKTGRTDSVTSAAAASPYHFNSSIVSEETPVQPIEQTVDADDSVDDQDIGSGENQSSSSIPATEMPSSARTDQVDTSEVEDEYDEEVFAEDYQAAAPHEQAVAEEQDDDDQLEVFDDQAAAETAGNQTTSVDDAPKSRGPELSRADGLVVIGQSPAKLAIARSPEKRLRPLPLHELGEAPLLSDLKFGVESVASPAKPAAKPVCQSPVKTSSKSADCPSASPAISPQMASPVKAQHGARSPVKSPAKSAKIGNEEQHKCENVDTDKEVEVPTVAARPAAAGRRRSSVKAEAPILASSFAPNHNDPEEEDHHRPDVEVNGVAASEANGGSMGDASAAFAFDTGAAITQAFGDRVARLLGADPWGDRQDGFDAIQYTVKKTDLTTAANKREMLCAALAAVECGVEDRVAPVMYCSLECLRTVLKEFSSVLDRSFVKFQPLNEQLSSLLRALVGKLGDANKRTQRESTQAISRLVKLRKLHALPHLLLHLSSKDVSPRLQIETLRRLVQDVGLGSPDVSSGKPSRGQQLTLDVIMQFVVPSLKIADEKTRKATTELLADLQMATSAAAVNTHLTGLKPDMLRVITRRVEELVTQRESEKQKAAQANTNQSEELKGEAEEADTRRAAEQLIPVMAEDSRAAITLLETQLNAASNLVGPVLWRKLQSKTWSDRKEALVDIERAVTEAKSDLRDAKAAFGSVIQHNFAGYCVVVHKFLGDSIQPVVNQALDVFTTLVKVFGPCVEWRDDVVRELTLLTLMRLFQTMQKPQNRTTRAACRCVLKLTRLPNSQHTLRYTLSCIFAKETDPAVQMHLLRLLIPEIGFQTDGLNAGLVLQASAHGLNHSSDKVRKVAADVVLATQRLVGRTLVLEKLKDVKPATLKELEKSFVDVERDSADRPQTVNASSSTTGPSSAALPPVTFATDRSRRQLSSAPVGVGRLQCTPQDEDDDMASVAPIAGLDAEPPRRATVLSNEEENLMDSILGGDDF